MRKQDKRSDAAARQSTKQVWRNNWFLIRLCLTASPIYVIIMTLDVIRSEFCIFLEHAYGIGYVLEAAEFHYPIREVAVFLIGIAICNTLGMLFSVVVNDYWAVRELPKVRRKVKLMLYEKAKELDLECYDNPEYYNEMVLAISQADQQIDRCITFLKNVASNITSFLSLGIYFLFKDQFSVLLAAAAFVIGFGFNQMYNRLSFRIRVERNPYERKREYIKRVFYLSDYAKELRLNPEASTLLFEDFEKANRKVYEVEKSYTRKRFFLSFLKSYIGNDLISDVVYISYLVYRAVVQKALSFSSVAILYHSFGWLKKNMRIFTDIYPYACETSLYVQKILDFLDSQPKIVSEKKQPVSAGAKAVELKNVSFSYGEKYGNVINDVSLSIAPGEKIALVGYNGAGKTTLIKLIMRLYDPSRGEILFDGINSKDYEVEGYRHSIGTVFQDFKVFGGTVTENVLLDIDEKKEGTEKKIKEALRRSGLLERVERLKKGLETQLTTEFAQDGVNLSGGESQKLAIGRVFYQDAGLIILDEPSSALDPIAEYQLNHSMLEATENKTVIFISHRLSTTRLADRIFLLEKGRIAEQGTHDKLLEQNGRYAKMWRAQAGQYIEV